MKSTVFRKSILCLVVTLTTWSLAAQEKEETWSMSVDNVSVEDFVKEVAMITGKTIIVDGRAKGNVTIFSEQELNKDGIYQLFLNSLRTIGLGAIEDGETVRVVQNQSLRQYGMSRNTDIENSSADSMISAVLSVKHIDNLELTKILRLVSPPYSHIAAIPNSKTIIITDHRNSIDAIRNLIQLLDVPDDRKTIVVNLKHAWVEDVSEMLSVLLPRSEQETSPQGNLFIVGNNRTNSLVLRGTAESIEQGLEIIGVIDQPTQTTGLTKVFRLNYANAEKTAGVLKEMTAPRSSSTSENPLQSGLITFDEELNAVIVRAEPTIMSEVEMLIAKLDVKRAQVLIEAAIVEVRVGDSDTLGVEIGIGDDGSSAVPVASSSLSGVLSGLLSSLAADGDINPDDLNAIDLLSGISSPTLAVAKLDPDGISFGAIIHALVTSSKANLLSTPHVMALDNVKADLQAGNVIPVRSGNFVFPGQQSDFPFASNTRVPIGIKLIVTPHINADLTVRLDVEQSVENVVSSDVNIGESGFADIVTAKNAITTSVIAENRHTVVLGGLIQNDKTVSERKVPGLGNIPLLGRLFSSKTTTIDKRHLLVFLRPTVVITESESDEISEEKYQSIWSNIINLDGKQGDTTDAPPVSDLYEGKKP